MTRESAGAGRHPLLSALLIAGVVGAFAVTFAYTAGWLAPDRLTPEKLVASLAPPEGAALGHRRNHSKGVCFKGSFEANGSGNALSSATLFNTGEYPVIGRFNVGSPDLYVKDAAVRVRGMSLEIRSPEGAVWRMALINLPFFPVSTPQAFYELQVASSDKRPAAMQQFKEGHPEFLAFLTWAGMAPQTASYSEERYNSIDSFIFVNSSGLRSIVRWSFVPTDVPMPISPRELALRDANFLETDITQRLSRSPVDWTMVVIMAGATDPVSDPSKPWMGEQRAIPVGRLVVKEIEPEADGPCRSINYDPTILPPGAETSDDPFLAARSSAYRRSYDLRTAESAFYSQYLSETRR